MTTSCEPLKTMKDLYVTCGLGLGGRNPGGDLGSPARVEPGFLRIAPVTRRLLDFALIRIGVDQVSRGHSAVPVK